MTTLTAINRKYQRQAEVLPTKDKVLLKKPHITLTRRTIGDYTYFQVVHGMGMTAFETEQEARDYIKNDLDASGVRKTDR